MTIDLYLSVFSPPCRTVQFVAKQLGIDVNLKNIDLRNGDHLKPDFVKLNPAHTIPTIDDDGFVLWESRAIAQYLCNKYAPDSELYPQDPERRAIVDRLLNFDIGTITPSIRDAFVVKLLRGKEPEEGKLEAFKNNLTLLSTFIGENNYVAGNNLTIADLSLLAIFAIVRITDFDLKEYPRVNGWLERLESELPYYEELQGNIIKILPTLFENIRSNAQQQANITTRV